MRKSAKPIMTETWNKDLNEGDSLQGVYIAKQTFQGNYGESVKYVIDCNGTMYGVFGSASLDSQFAQIPVDSFVWITYKGEVQSKNGRTVKQYDVDYDDEYQK